jgi:hypothetical protein
MNRVSPSWSSRKVAMSARVITLPSPGRADNAVRVAHRSVDCPAVAQLAGDHSELGVAHRQLSGRADNRNHVITTAERLLDYVAPDAARGAEDDNPARVSRISICR